MPLLLFVFLLFVGNSTAQSDASSDDKNRDQAIGAFARGETLSWDQLQVVASQAGMSRDLIAETKIKNQMTQLIQKYKLPLEVTGFSAGMLPDEEFRLYKGRRPGWGAVVLNADFWHTSVGVYDTDEFLTYLLFRAEAYFIYRSHYDSAHCAWIVEEESPSMQVLKTTIEASGTHWAVDDGPPTGRDLEFRKSLDPTLNPSRSLKALAEYALRAIAQKASDDWAQLRFQKEVGTPGPLISQGINRRERALAWDFNAARSAMTRTERVTFQNLLKSPFRYVRAAGAASSEPSYDPTPSPQ